MSDDKERQEGATSRDLSRQAATTPDSDFTLSIDDAAALYERAGHPRTPRSIQHYCAKGHLEYRRMETPFGEKFLITPASVVKHIGYIEEVRPVATGRDLSRHAATDVAGENKAEEIAPKAATNPDEPRQAATVSSVSRPVAADNRIIELLESENKFLRGQIAVKDDQIGSMQERMREDNLLINGLQRLLAPLLPGSERDRQTPASAE